MHMSYAYMNSKKTNKTVNIKMIIYNSVEFYLYPTVSTALVHSVKPKLTE